MGSCRRCSGRPRGRRDLPDWMPSVVAGARSVVLLVLDGLGWDQLQDHRDLMPTVASMTGGPIHTVAPTTTATALSSITTGLTPAEHGLIGYRIVLGGEIMNVLRWTVGEQAVRRSRPPHDIQPFDPFLGRTVPVVSPAELQNSAFSEAHLRGCRAVGWRAASSIAVEARRQVEAGERFVYCYYGGIDKIAHERGFGPYYEAELRAADVLVADVLAALPTGTALLVTADHGQVHVGDRIVVPSAALLADVTMQSGEGRFRWLHTPKGAADDVAATRARRGGRRCVGRHEAADTRRAVVRRVDGPGDPITAGRCRTRGQRAGELRRSGRLGSVRTGLPTRIAHLRGGQRAARRRRRLRSAEAKSDRKADMSDTTEAPAVIEPARARPARRGSRSR